MRINVRRSAVEVKVKSAFKAALPMLASEIRAGCNEYCKEDTGALIASSMIHSKLEEGKIVWQTPYAKRQYWEIQTAYRDTNPKATWQWCEAAKARYRDEWRKQAQMLFEGNL